MCFRQFVTLGWVLLGAPAVAGETAKENPGMKLWYTKPASQWVEALAIGNGRLGAMVFGKTEGERIQLNEGTLWAGAPYDPSNSDALAALPEARRLIFAGKFREANNLIGQKMMAKPINQMPYQPLGDLLLTFGGPKDVTDYRRELDLDTAVARTTYACGGAKFTREVFASPVDQVIVVRLTADKPGILAFTATMATPQKATIAAQAPDVLVMSGTGGDASGIKGVLKFQARVRVLAQGGLTAAGAKEVTVSGANSATLLIAAATSYKSFKDTSGDPEAMVTAQIAAAAAKPFERLLADHVTEHQRLFRRVTLDLGATDAAKRPTDERLKAYGAGNDPQLAALYFQFARYLLISCSRPGGQPATLQGLWNESMNPPWQSKYTININTEMNYWPADTCNIGECIEPLFRMVLDLTETGARTAKVHYGAKGWVCHHNTDLWRASAPIDGPAWGFWPTGGAWLCNALWDHYEFTGDRDTLTRLYPAIRGAAEFFLDALVEEPKHKWLVTCPSLSPENAHPGGVSVCAGPTMDEEIIRDLFSNCIRAAELLGTDAEFRQRVEAARQRLAPCQIGKEGQLQEWLDDWDLQAPERQHRHVSHLYGLFPSAQITPRGTPELAAAVRKSLELRGDGGTGWSKAWKINLWARLLDGDHAYKLLREAITGNTYANLFDAHPPFQIDGNFGGGSGMAEMFLQSHAGDIELLPALPKAWPTGSVRGLRARGGFEVDIAWKDGQLAEATVTSLLGNPCRLRCGKETREPKIAKGETYRWTR